MTSFPEMLQNAYEEGVEQRDHVLARALPTVNPYSLDEGGPDEGWLRELRAAWRDGLLGMPQQNGCGPMVH